MYLCDLCLLTFKMPSLKSDNLETLVKEADHILALPKKAQAIVCSAQHPVAESDEAYDDQN